MKDMILTDEMKKVEQLIKSGQNVFVTGKAGTGKTTFLKYIVEKNQGHCIVVAPTGVAAINAGGVTIHSLIGLPFGPFPPVCKFQKRLSDKKTAILIHIKTLIIDEVSMVRPDTMDAIDKRLRYVRNSQEPFGGVQVVMFGDPYQLPPVIKKDEKEILDQFYDSYFFFSALVWKQVGFHVVELNKIFRQTDLEFVDILNKIRNYTINSDELDVLAELKNKAITHNYDNKNIHVCTHKNTVEHINEEQLGTENIHQFDAEITGTFPESSIPCDCTLKLRVGARIMAITNNAFRGYYNGMLGVVFDIKEDMVVAKMDNGSIIEFNKHTWSNIQYVMKDGKIEAEEIGSCTQYPIALAWAITIHKSQGLTFDNIALHISRTFCPGQLYVALSRCRSLQGIVTDAYITKKMIIPEYALLDFERAYKAENNYYGRRI